MKDNTIENPWFKFEGFQGCQSNYAGKDMLVTAFIISLSYYLIMKNYGEFSPIICHHPIISLSPYGSSYV
jgi:hypothetical protein